jgi:RNA polymerase sigma-70 factor (sigma-E family)
MGWRVFLRAWRYLRTGLCVSISDMAEGIPVGVEDRSSEVDQVADSGLEELYARHIGAGVRLSFLLTGDRVHAEDLAQEAFVRCVGRFRHVRQPDAFESYFRRAIVNLHTSGLRRRRLERAWLAREGAASARRVASQPDVGARQDLWRALGQLPARQRAALVLRYYEDLSERDTAEVLGCSVAAVKSLVARGSEALRELIRGEEA